MERKFYLFNIILVLLFFFPAFLESEASPKKFAILHTNDLQSRLLGYGPNSEYSPNTTNDDNTVGGFARLTTKIKQQRQILEKAGYAVLLLDGGDITMGTLFHTVVRQTGGELRLLGYAGYDAVVIGNHEFDFAAKGLSQMIRSAQKNSPVLPKFLLANIETNPNDQSDDELEKLFQEKVIVPYHIIEKNGIRFGIFGLIGYDAWEVTAKQKPLTQLDPIQTAKKIVKLLKQNEKADVIVLCSHGGVHQSAQREFLGSGEDIDYAKEVPEIDVIVGGHSHTPIFKPVLVNGQTPVLQAGSEAKFLGELKMTVIKSKRPVFEKYKLHEINDSIPGDSGASAIIDKLKKQINQKVLIKYGLRFDQKMAEIPVDFTRKQSDNILGNLMADSIRTQSGAMIAITTQGTIRDNLYKGKNGVQWLSDIFRLAPLGEGEFGTETGYPLAKIYITANELKSLLEVLTIGYRTKGLSYYPRFSGLRFEYNSWRVPLDTVYKIEILDENGKYQEIDYSKNNRKLLSISSNIYIARFFPMVKKLSKGILEVIPKDVNGKIIVDMNDSIIDGDLNQSGIQEIKEWYAIIKYIQGFKDINGNGIIDLPATGSTTQSRMINKPGFANFFTNAGFTWIYLVLLVLVCGVVIFGLRKKFLRKT